MQQTTFQIEASDHRCVGCTTEIVAGQGYYSTVMFLEEAFARRNYCESCWPEVGRRGVAVVVPPRSPASSCPVPPGSSSQTVLAEIFAFWKSVRPQPTQKAARRVRFDPLLVLEFFRRLGDGRDGTATTEGTGREEAEQGHPDAESSAPADGDPDVGSSHRPSVAQRRNLRFVLALLLIRKKALVFGSSARRDDREWLQVKERADPQRAYWIENVDLGDAELERVRDDIGQLLEMQV